MGWDAGGSVLWGGSFAAVEAHVRGDDLGDGVGGRVGWRRGARCSALRTSRARAAPGAPLTRATPRLWKNTLEVVGLGPRGVADLETPPRSDIAFLFFSGRACYAATHAVHRAPFFSGSSNSPQKQHASSQPHYFQHGAGKDVCALRKSSGLRLGLKGWQFSNVVGKGQIEGVDAAERRDVGDAAAR